MPVRYDRRRQKFYVRCHHCGDSEKSEDHAHLAVFYQSGFYRCYRCGVEGYLPLQQIFKLSLEILGESPQRDSNATNRVPLDPTIAEDVVFRRDPTGRFTLIPRQQAVPQHGQGHVDIFPCRKLNGEVVGYHLRASWEKVSNTHGQRMFGYAGEAIPRGSQIRLVEGPYDVRRPEDVCVFGIPYATQVKALLGYQVILCPDGDVWGDPPLLQSWMRPFNKMGALIQWVERLPDGMDPDEVPASERTRLSWKEVQSLLKPQREKSSILAWASGPHNDPHALGPEWGVW